MVLIIDNYDSFVYNLARYVNRLGIKTRVIRNDKITLAEIKKMRPSHIILSPGPKKPENAGICLDIVKSFSGNIPLLGVCLGHQAIAQAFGATITRAKAPMHGMASTITNYKKNSILSPISRPFKVGRYHSLIIAPHTLPKEFEIIAYSNKNEIMAIAHKKHKTVGVQFHPESILSEFGQEMIGWFVEEAMIETQ